MAVYPNVLRTAAEVEALIARMDVVLTTRLHRAVLELKNSVPVVAVDSVLGGAKFADQAKVVGWPVYLVERLQRDELQAALRLCLTPEARLQARECADRAAAKVRELGAAFQDEFRDV